MPAPAARQPSVAPDGVPGAPPPAYRPQPPSRSDAGRSRGSSSQEPQLGLRRLRTLRWRLALVYAGILTLLVLGLGLALNVVVSRVLFNSELTSFATESRIIVARQQTRFQELIQGPTISGQSTPAGVCPATESYQQAFNDGIEVPLQNQTDLQATYLLDNFGDVLVASGDSSVAVDQTAPYLRAAPLTSVRTQMASGAALTTIAVKYLDTTPSGQQIGVVLMPMRFRTTSTCLRPGTRPIVGMVEVVTNLSDAQRVLRTLHTVLVLCVLSMFAAGLLIGGPLIAQALRPLSLMAQAARRIASGDLSQRVRLPHRDDEIGQLADTFDEMVDRIEAAFAAQGASEQRMRQFIADASHELRTPLTGIRGYIDVLLRGAKDDPATAEEVLLATRREAERMSRLVNDLLTLARLDAGRALDRQPVDLIALAGEAVDEARILAGQREVSLATDGAGRLIVPADPDRLKQILLILLDNALKYGRPEPEGWVRVRISRTERGAVVTVTDNGQGIHPEDQPHIFDRFYRGDRAARQRRMTGSQVAARPAEPPALYGADATSGTGSSPNRAPAGSGLGLAIAQAIVRSHGGSLTVQSRLGVGTTFTIMLPRS
jgi:signal transduction histidine kinase